ncbi:hypothetical protein Zmor_021182 [Zophobas morio]|uniref:Peptidase S1 domain-containing protein n=1 Tax=Zophobas morio TaxID=2755281 RepID=A0AA38I4Z6_9CUCU|nr:hypothetical protein Zmor_021182 [Zophobas morio]
MMRVFLFMCFYITLGYSLPLENEVKSDVLQVQNSRIINGENATLGQFPWHAALFLMISETVWTCGGSIISKDWILTAAQCLQHVDVAFIYVGTVNLNPPPERIVSREFIVHEEFSLITLANDIGLIKLSTALSFSDTIAPIALPSEPLEGGEEVTVSGFGATSDDADDSDILKYITATTMTNSECAVIYVDAILEGMVCTSAGSDPFKSTCFGDSGGPAVLNADTDPLQVGISSFFGDSGCEKGYPFGFTRTAYYRDWIKEKTGV